MVRSLLEEGVGWGLLPTHFQAERWRDVQPLRTEVGNQGISQTMVTIWKPGNDKRAMIDETLALMPLLWRSAG